MEYIESEQFDSREIEILILDEADRMLTMGFAETINRIVQEARWRKQTMLFSATLEGAAVVRFSRELLNDPVFLEANPSRKEKAKIHQWMHLADNKEHKFALLLNLLQQEEVGRALVFANKRETVQYLSGKLYADNVPCVWLEGKMQQDKRNTSVERLRNGTVNVLVATDIAERGLDIDDITHVINFDMPRTADIYLHRIGRTGRAGNKGTAISLVEAHDMLVIGKIERYIKERLPRRVIETLRPKFKEARVATKKTKVKRTVAQKKAKAKKVAKRGKS
jgi:ATP-dependent RNA helicase SrmB